MLDHQSWTIGQDALKNPVLASFKAHWRAYADRVGTAFALPEAMGPFAATSDGSDRAGEDFVALLKARKSSALLVHQDEITVPVGLNELQRLRGFQMIPTPLIQTGNVARFGDLGPSDAMDMLRLAQMTKPGPFAAKTYQLGDFIGLRKNGELIAMAGQRMAFDGWIEISGVCVHPDFRQRGLARKLVLAMINRIYQSGAQPFLHTFADNSVAIDLYRSLGFEIRTEMNVVQVAP